MSAFIVLEGVDGSGKTGAIAALDAALRPDVPDMVVTREPGGTEEGTAVRRLLLARDGLDWEPVAELLLMAAARAQHIARIIAPARQRGALVLSDRFAGSTLAYQGGGRGLDEGLIRDLHRMTAGDLWPDLTVILDIDPAVGLSRSQHRLTGGGVDEGRFEALDLAFHQRVRHSFLAQAAHRPEGHVVIDAARAPPDVQADVVRAVRRFLNGRGLSERQR
jgi:dTMP kinase